MNDTDSGHMRHALRLGARATGRTWPNPAVGCVIVKNQRIIGRGWTQDGGRPHAETQALAQAGVDAAGAIAYVTLEPCAHQGETPPCAQALISAGIGRVVVATTDPDPRVNGAGIAMLRKAGVKVSTGVLEEVAKRQHAGFKSRITLGRPNVTLKLAASLDGRIATASGESQWITGPHARRIVHLQRSQHDAVMVGGGTARADDPSLNVRDLGVTHQPVRVIWSSQLDLPLQSQLAQTAKEIPLWILHSKDADPNLCNAWEGLGARLLSVATGKDRKIDPLAALLALGQAGLNTIYCEGGGTLAASLLSAGLVDELVTFTAGLVLGADGVPMLAAMGIAELKAANRFQLVSTRAIGFDTMSLWRAP